MIEELKLRLLMPRQEKMLKRKSRQGGHRLRKPMLKQEKLPRKLKQQGKKLLTNKGRKSFGPILLLKKR